MDALPRDSLSGMQHRSAFVFATFASLLLHAILIVGLQDIEIQPLDTLSEAPIVAELRTTAPPSLPQPRAAAKQSVISPRAPIRTQRSALATKAPTTETPTPPAGDIPRATSNPVAASAQPSQGSQSEEAKTSAAPAVATEPVREALDTALVGRYRLAMTCALKRHRFYPVYAQKREWTGRVDLRADFGESGEMTQVRVTRSSGYTQLDEAAVETLRRAQADVALPQRLLGHSFNVEQTLTYDLDGLDQGETPASCPKP